MKWEVVDPADMKKTFGSSLGAQASIEVYEADGEKEYYVECYCGVCWEISNVGLGTFDPGLGTGPPQSVDDLEPGVYFVKHVVEKTNHPEYGAEYDTWLELNEGEDDAGV